MSQPTPTPLPRLWDDLKLRSYLGEIRRRYGIVEILALPSMRDLPPVRIETLFVSPLLAKCEVTADSDPKQWPQGQSLFAALEQNSHLVVLGDPGSGKTTLANWLAWRLSAGLTAPLPKVLEDRVPLPCVLREMKADIFAAETTLPELAERISRRLLGDKADATLLASLRERVAAGSYVLILDGVDEIPVSHRKTVAGWVRQAAAQQACVLATSRMVGYEDGPVDREEAALRLDLPKGFSEKPGNLRLSGDRGEIEAETKTDKPAWAQRCYLMPFGPDQIAAFAENWYRQRCGTEQEARQKTDDLLVALDRSEVTQRLARTPNLLTLMAIVHRETAHLPDGKALLYEQIANAYINTIDSYRKIEPGDALAPFRWKERKAWLARIGFEMQQRRSADTKEMGRDAGVLAREADVLTWLADAMRASGVDQPEQTAGAYLGWVARRSGLLLPRGEGCHAFVHMSFQEYFCACFLADRIVSPAFVKNPNSSDGPVSQDLLRQWSGESIWRETLVFLFELLSERDADWMEYLADILFGLVQDTNKLDENRAMLAARALVDQHVRLGQDRRERLADLCSTLAMREWDMRRSRKLDMLPNVLPALLKAGFADIVAGPEDMAHKGVSRREDSPGLYARKIADLEEIRKEPRLRVLIVTGISINDVKPLAELTGLQALDLSGTRVADVAPLSKLAGLQWLDLKGTRVVNVGPLEKLARLQVLDLGNTLRVADVAPLTGLESLQWLGLKSTRVADVKPLTELTGLQALDLSSTPVADVAPLVKLTALQWLDLSGTPVADVAPLAKLTALKWLNLSGTPVADVAPLAKLTALQWLNLSGTKVADVAPLAGLPILEVLIGGKRIRPTELHSHHLAPKPG